MTILAIDGNSLINRAYYGVAPLTAKDGTPTGALFGFLNMLERALKAYHPDGLCVAFDLRGKTFRHHLDPNYKATRKGMPEDLAAQMPVLREILSALNVPVYTAEGFEADDVLGTIARLCGEAGADCRIMTGDRDSFQLISERTQVLYQSGRAETALCDTAYVRERYGLTPAQLIDLKALMGDSSDNIPGVPGVGEKTALALMQAYGSLEAIYEAISGGSGVTLIKQGIKDKLVNGKESAELSRTLAIIDQNVPLDFAPQDTLRAAPDAEALAAVFTRLDFQRLLAKWQLSSAAPVHPEYEKPPECFLAAGPHGVRFTPDGVCVVHDYKSLLNKGFQTTAPVYDTLLAMWLLDSSGDRYNLPDTGAAAHWHVYHETRGALARTGMDKLYADIELPLCHVLADMEALGIAVDRENLSAMGRMLGGWIAGLEQTIYTLAGQVFNIGSTQQLAGILFDQLGLPPSKKTKTGYSTDTEVLEKLRGRHAIIGPLMEYRKLTKLKSTYTDGLQRLLTPEDKIHTTFQMTATATGRLSSTEPNLQNIPIRQALGGELRKLFVPSRPGWVFIDADYSQIELRILAHFARDEAMQTAFIHGQDIHTATASQVFGVPAEHVTASMRRSAKAVNFGIVYGISEFSLAQDIGVTRAEAAQYMRSYFNTYAGVRRYMDEVVAQARKDGFVTTAFGRRRYIPELSSGNFNIRSFGERVALNAPIQGTAADIIKLAMIRAAARLKADGLQARLVLQVHDELLVEAPEAEADRAAALLTEEMQAVVDWPVPLVAEAHVGVNWYEAK
jgi:DNA polymerase-1